jgi:hypothetical protein
MLVASLDEVVVVTKMAVRLTGSPSIQERIHVDGPTVSLGLTC